MAFVASEGQVRKLSRLELPRTTSVQLSSDYTADYAQIWRSQAAVRMVTTFLARNIASLGLHVFERVSDTDRRRVRDHPLAELLSRPNPFTTRYRLVDALVHDIAIYDCAYWLKLKTDDGKPGLLRLPPNRVTPKGDSWLLPDYFEVTGERGKREIPTDQVVFFRGYAPDGVTGSSPIESLRRVLAEDFEASRMREQVLRNGARVSGYITRPAGTEWSPGACERFRRGWQQQYAGNGPGAGGTPILEDGMEFQAASQTAKELQYVETRMLTREEVAASYFIPPPMVGLLDKATFSNITEQHKMLYQDTLGPWLSMIAEEIDLQLLPDLGDSRSTYSEFNLAEKLKGSFEEQAAAMSTMVGAPVMSRNEGRGRLNLPSIDGADDLVTPLNVLVGGQSSPRDSGEQNLRTGLPQVKSAPTRFKATDLGGDEWVPKAKEVLTAFFTRQERVVRSVLGSKADEDYWDEDRWNEELADDLYALAVTASTQMGKAQAMALGFSATDYDVDRTLAFLRTVAARRSEMVNATTLGRIKSAIGAGDPVASVFDEARSARAGSGATALMTALSGFALTEATKQTTGDRASKEWVVNSSNPRSEHAAMNGEQVGLDDTFSNGAMWPGDSVLGAEGVANCQCTTDVVLP